MHEAYVVAAVKLLHVRKYSKERTMECDLTPVILRKRDLVQRTFLKIWNTKVKFRERASG